ncbi:MAG: DNA primase [Ignavibacteria bacterium]|nr:DNA primase [Ignavibacteria bacterium]
MFGNEYRNLEAHLFYFSMQIPDHIIDQVRQRTDIVEIIGESVALKKSGRSFVGLCPFHSDRKPSMNVSPDLQIFKCFSCGKGGNVFTFMTDFHRLTFLEALKALAAKAGIALPDEDKPHDESYNRVDSAYKALAAASQFYHDTLSKSSGKIALQYFTKRGFTRKLIDDFALGFSPESFTATLAELTKRGFSESVMNDAGLILKKEEPGSKPYDRFRGRAMFAIHDVSGRVVGFGARQMKDDGQAKYINSPQSLVYDKSKILYALFQAKQEIRSLQVAILVEGYADALTLHQAGFRNTVASSGTSLTKDQLQLLARYAKKMYIVYDADTAGINAASRGLELAVEEGFDVHIVQLPAGDDPDSFVKKNGADSFRIYLRDAKPFLDFKIDIMKANNLLESPVGKAEAIRSLVQIIAKVPDTLQHDFLMGRVSDRLDLSASQLRRIYEELTNVRRANTAKSSPKMGYTQQNVQQNVLQAESQSTHQTENQNVLPATSSPVSSDTALVTLAELAMSENLLPEEKSVLRIALTVSNALRYMVEQLKIEETLFYTEPARRIYSLAIDALNRGSQNIFSSLVANASISEEMMHIITDIAMQREMPSEKWLDFKIAVPEENARRVLTDSLMKMQIKSIDREKQVIQSQMKSVSQEESLPLLQRLIQITSQRKEILEKMGG